MDSDPKRIEAIYENNDLYYLAGEYDPIVGTIRFEKGVLDDWKQIRDPRFKVASILNGSDRRIFILDLYLLASKLTDPTPQIW